MTSPSARWTSDVCLPLCYLCPNEPDPKLLRLWFLRLENTNLGILPIIQKAVSATCMAPAAQTLGPGVSSSCLSALLIAVPPTAILTFLTHIAAPLSFLSALAMVSQWSTAAAHVTMASSSANAISHIMTVVLIVAVVVAPSNMQIVKHI